MIKQAGFWIRVLATIIDGIILGILLKILSFILFGSLVSEPGTSGDFISVLMGGIRNFILNVLVSMCYETILIGYNGQTIGKLITRIKVVNVDGSAITYSKSFARFWSKSLSALSFCIGYLLIAFRKDKRGLHDLIVDTKVVKLSGTVPIQGQSPQS